MCTVLSVVDWPQARLFSCQWGHQSGQIPMPVLDAGLWPSFCGLFCTTDWAWNLLGLWAGTSQKPSRLWTFLVQIRLKRCVGPSVIFKLNLFLSTTKVFQVNFQIFRWINGCVHTMDLKMLSRCHGLACKRSGCSYQEVKHEGRTKLRAHFWKTSSCKDQGLVLRNNIRFLVGFFHPNVVEPFKGANNP